MDSYRFFLPILLFSLPAAAADPTMRICYFSLNEEKEVPATKNLMDKIQAGTGVKVEVKEFLTRGANPNESFKKMVESGVRCDGLVISGHHTGAWGGHRAKGKLSMDFIEGLSCDPKNSEWFRNVNAAWLQGCRTLGVGEIEADDTQESADFHTNRVGQVLEADGLMDTSFADLNMEFSSTLDQDNPLASRYLRLLPSAKLFGWTRSAPGEKVGSWKSVLFHMTQVARLLDDENTFPQSPTTPTFSAESAARYANAVLLTLNRFAVEDKSCEDIATQGWLAHGNVGRPGQYFFDNPDLKALPSLNSSGDETLLQAKEIDCLLKDALKTKSAAKLNRGLDMITAKPDYLRYSFNTIIDMRNQLVKQKSPLADTVLARMRTHPQINAFLSAKLKSNQVGVLRKIDYYKFSQELSGDTDRELEKEIVNAAMKEFARPLPPLDPTATIPARSRNLAADFRATLFQSVLKNRLAGRNFYKDLFSQNPDADLLKAMALHARSFNPREAKQNLLIAGRSPNANRQVAASVLKELDKLNLQPQEYNAYYAEIWGKLEHVSASPSASPGAAQPIGSPTQLQPNPQQNTDPLGSFFRGIFGGN